MLGTLFSLLPQVYKEDVFMNMATLTHRIASEAVMTKVDAEPVDKSARMGDRPEEQRSSERPRQVADFEIISQTRPARGGRSTIDLSVIVPTSNTEAYLNETLSGLTVQADLRIELIVVDYKSTDRTVEKVLEFAGRYPDISLTVVRQNCPGLGDARNFGMRRATGEFVVVLDSDDFFMPFTYWEMVQYARTNACDLVFCRGTVFDERTGETWPFYDDWVWIDILDKRYSSTMTARGEPRLFRLEPNASIRLLRRQFVLDNDIFYPEKKRAEDLVPHYRALFEAGRIGVISKRGLFYRIGRAGKLTSEPSHWIGDLLDATYTALGESFHYGPSDDMGAAMVYLWVRSLFGYGARLPYTERRAYYRDASMIFAQIPESWVRCAFAEPLHPDRAMDVRLRLALLGLRARDAGFLVFWSGSPRSIRSILGRIPMHPAVLKELLVRYLRWGNFRSGLRLLRKAAKCPR